MADDIVTGIQIQLGLDTGKFDNGAVRLQANAKKITAAFNEISGLKTDQKLQEVERAVERLGGVANLSAPQVAKLRGELDKLAKAGATIPKTLQLPKVDTGGIEKAFAGLGSSQLSGLTSSIGGVGSALGALGPIGLAAAAAIGATTAAFAAAVTAAAEYGSQVKDISEKTGFSTDAVQELGYAVRQSGGDFQNVAKSASVMERQIAAGAKVFKDLGLDVAQLRQLKPEEAFVQVAEAIKGLSDPYQQAQAAAQAFGKAGVELLPAIRSGLKDLSAEAHEFGQVLNEDGVNAGDRFGDAMERASKAWTVLKATVGGKIIGTLQLDVALNTLAKVVANPSDLLHPLDAEARDRKQLEDQVLAKASARNTLGSGPQESPLFSTAGLEAQIQALSKVGQESQQAKKDLAEFEAAARQADQEIKALSQALGQHFDELAKKRAKRENRADAQDALLGGNAAAQFESEKIQAAIVDVGGVANLTAKQIEYLSQKFYELSKSGVEIPQDLGAISQAADQMQLDEAANKVAALDDQFIELIKTLAEMGQGPFAGFSGEQIDALFGRIAPEIDKAKDATVDWSAVLHDVANAFQVLGISADSSLGKIIGGIAAAAAAGKNLKEGVGKGGVAGYTQAGIAGLGVLGSAYKSKSVGGGAAQGAAAGAAFGPYGAIIGGIAGGIAGFLGKRKAEKDAKEIGKALGHKVTEGFVEQAKNLAKELHISLAEAAKKLEREELLGKLADVQGKASANAGLITGSLGGFGQIKGAADAQGRIFGKQFWAVVGVEGFSAALDAFKATFDKLPETLKAAIPADLQNIFKFADNEQFKSAVDGVSQMAQGFKGLVGTIGLSKETMADYGQVAQASFDQAKAGALESGATQEEAQKAAIQAVIPLLSQMKSASLQTGQALDPATQGLLNQAEAAGISIPIDPLIEVADTLRQMLDLQRQLAGLPPLAPKVDTTDLDKASAAGEKAGKDLADGIERGSQGSSEAASKALDPEELKAKMAELGAQGGAALGEGIADGVKDIGLAADGATAGVGDLGTQGQETSKTLQDGLAEATSRMSALEAQALKTAAAVGSIPPIPGGTTTTTTGPGFATGGIGRFDRRGTHAILHGTEAVLPLDRPSDFDRVFEDMARARPDLVAGAISRIATPIPGRVPSFAAGGFTDGGITDTGGFGGVGGGGGGAISAPISVSLTVYASGDVQSIGEQVAAAFDAEIPVLMDAQARMLRRELGA